LIYIIFIHLQKVVTCKCDSLFKPEWEKYIGTYVLSFQGMELRWYDRFAQFLGFGYQKIKIAKVGQGLKISGWSGESTLKEFIPGLFFTVLS
jgi:hypothetical protein